MTNLSDEVEEPNLRHPGRSIEVTDCVPYYKELIRRAAVLAVLQDGADGRDLVVTGVHLEQAIDELAEGGRLAGRILGFHQSGEEDSVRSMVTGFPQCS